MYVRGFVGEAPGHYQNRGRGGRASAIGQDRSSPPPRVQWELVNPVLRPRAAIMRRVNRALVCMMDDDRYVYLWKVDVRVSLALVRPQPQSSGPHLHHHEHREAAARRLSDSNGRAEPAASGWSDGLWARCSALLTPQGGGGLRGQCV
jgi:hypothetical protein